MTIACWASKAGSESDWKRHHALTSIKALVRALTRTAEGSEKRVVQYTSDQNPRRLNGARTTSGGDAFGTTATITRQ